MELEYEIVPLRTGMLLVGFVFAKEIFVQGPENSIIPFLHVKDFFPGINFLNKTNVLLTKTLLHWIQKVKQRSMQIGNCDYSNVIYPKVKSKYMELNIECRMCGI